MRRIALAALCFAIVGCGGNSNNSGLEGRFAGQWEGTWVNTANAADAGTSTWTISRSGEVTGQDVDPGRDTTFNVVGHVDATGMLHSTSTSGESSASLNGPFTFGNDGFLHGTLVWGVNPPLTYTYTFHRMP